MGGVELEVVCPAGDFISQTPDGSPGVRCKIAHETISARANPNSISRWCTGDHTDCPTWRANHEADERGEGKALRAENERLARVTRS